MSNSLDRYFLITNPIVVLPKTTAAKSEIYASSQLALLDKTFKILQISKFTRDSWNRHQRPIHPFAQSFW